jgi:hypothetical protein
MIVKYNILIGRLLGKKMKVFSLAILKRLKYFPIFIVFSEMKNADKLRQLPGDFEETRTTTKGVFLNKVIKI